MEILLICAVGVLNIICFFVGAKIGQKVVKGEEIKSPEFRNPIREYLNNKDAEAEQKRYKTIMDNIDSYNGTSAGQKDVM